MVDLLFAKQICIGWKNWADFSLVKWCWFAKVAKFPKLSFYMVGTVVWKNSSLDIFMWKLFVVKYFHLLGSQMNFFNNKVFLRFDFCSVAHKLNVYYICNRGRRDLPDMYAWAWGHTVPEGKFGHIKQILIALHMLCKTSSTLKICQTCLSLYY